MSESDNPYQPPPAEHRLTWWEWLLNQFSSVPPRVPDLMLGDLIFCNGIAFFIEDNQPSILYAASPSSVTTEERMNLIVSETIRALPHFLSDNPQWESEIRGRKLTVRMVVHYDKTDECVFPDVVLDWDIINATLASTYVEVE